MALDDTVELRPCDRWEWERVIKRLRIPSQVKYLALMAATYGDPDGTRVHPGIPRLAAVMNVSEATVKRSLSELRNLGLLKMVKKGNRYTGESDDYRLTVPSNVAEMPMLPPEEVKKSRDRR